MSNDGIDPSGNAVTVPSYRHNVSLDFTRLELTPEYAFAENWDVKLRLPYDIKRRKASISPVDPATQTEIDAMLRDVAVHHPSKTLDGFSDWQLLLTRYLPNALIVGDSMTFSFGSSLPVGKIQDDPYALGNAGLPHEHIQFGNGTFDPLLELSYGLPITEHWRAGVFASGRFPVYENRKGFQGSKEINAGIQTSYLFESGWSAHASFLASHQAFAYWDGVRDEDTGANRTNGLVGFGRYLGSGVYMSLDYLFPLTNHSFVSGGDSFEQGQIFLLSTSLSF